MAIVPRRSSRSAYPRKSRRRTRSSFTRVALGGHHVLLMPVDYRAACVDYHARSSGGNRVHHRRRANAFHAAEGAALFRPTPYPLNAPEDQGDPPTLPRVSRASKLGGAASPNGTVFHFLSSGSTYPAKHRMQRSASTYGMPAKLKLQLMAFMYRISRI